jgi:WD40 repeat protein
MFGLALMLALGLAVGPIVLSQTANLGLEIGLKLGIAFAVVGLLANAAVVLLTRMSIPGKVATMTSIGTLVTGVFLFGATAYLAGRKDASEQSKSELPTQPPPKPPDQKPDPPPDPPVQRPPTAMDVAYKKGVYRFEDGPDDVTALAVPADSSVLVIGYKNGITRIWRFERSTIDPSDFDLGPKSDGPPTNIQFDATESIIYMTCTGGTVAALWNTPPEVPVKLPGDFIASFAAPGGERFAALRGNTLTIRYIPTTLIKKPIVAPKKAATPAKTKGFLVTAATDELTPNDAKGQLAAPAGRLTFLAWHPTGKLLGGMPDGSILSWGTTGPGSTIATREHKAPVRAWAASPSTWDFATGDDKGVIGIWADKSMTPKTFIASASAAITHLSFSPSGSHLAAKDAEGTISVWDLSAHRAILKVRRPAAKAIAYGPDDDLLLLSDGKAVELWFIPELDRRP